MILLIRNTAAFLAILIVALSPSLAHAADPNPEQAAREHDFEQHIRPLLIQRCVSCHGPDKQQGDVRLDGRTAVLGSEGHPGHVVPGKPDESRLIQVIRYTKDDTQMPPTGKLPEDEIQLLVNWVQQGAAWPAGNETAHAGPGAFPHTADGKIDFQAVAADHWSFRPIAKPAPPQVQNKDVARTPIDRFVQAKLESAGLSMSPQADRRTLIKRLWFDLTGLSPSYADVEAFAADESPDGYERLVDRLLATPEYGQRWGRHWLDIARYADTKGYVFTENRYYPFSFTYRDYVIDAFNADKPYDRFVTEQLAADQLELASGDPALAALGFLTVGRRFLNNQQDIIDDRIDVVSRGLLGLSVGCARCHDHKFDPIPTADYYSLYGVFASCHEPPDLPMIGKPADIAAGKAYTEELAKREAAVEAYTKATTEELLNLLRTRAGDYLLRIARDAKRLPEGAPVPFDGDQPREKLADRWRRFLEKRPAEDPVLRPWKSLFEVAEADFPTRVSGLLAEATEGKAPLNPRLRDALIANPPKSIAELAVLYRGVFSAVNQEWQAAVAANAGVANLPDAPAEEIRRILYGEGSVSDVAGDRVQRLFERDHRDHLKNLRQQIAALNVESAGAPPRAMILVDNDQPTEPVVFIRGNPGRPGDQVPRRFLQVLEPQGTPFQKGSGRLELARDITSPENPLTARVIANRVWMLHFGSPLVQSPSDFGFRSDPPTNPELLDYLASRLIQNGWSLKELHREILLSAAWRQSSADRTDARAVDPENSLYWRMNRRRREFESLRDAWLEAAGKLDESLHGKPVNLESQPFTTRRTIYGLVDRNNLPGLLRTFDFPTPDVSSAGRPQTTVPQQALFGMNSPFVQEMAASLADRTSSEPDAARRVALMFETALDRQATPEETEAFAGAVTRGELNWTNLAQVLLMSNEFTYID
jgi:hypothetical protein